MVPKIPQGMKRPIGGSFETLVALQRFSWAGEHTKRASVPYLLLFLRNQCIRAALNPCRGDRSPLGNVQDAMEKKISAFCSLLSPLCTACRWLPEDEENTHG